MVRHYYLGGNTPLGFFSYYDNLINQANARKIYVIKGGPGTGKSTFMKKVGNWATEQGFDTDYLHCSSDPDSLDGLIIQDINVALVDGTAPHIVDPKNPGAVDSIVNLGDFWNEEGIRTNKDNIINFNNEIKKCFGSAYNYLKAAKAIFDETGGIYTQALDELAIRQLADEIASEEIPDVLNAKGSNRKLFVTAITPKGVIGFIDSLTQNNKVYMLKSDWGAGGNILLNDIANRALSSGYNIETFYNPMEPAQYIEHLIIKDLNLAFITQNKYNSINIAPIETIEMQSLYNQEILQAYSTEMDYNLSNMDSLIHMSVYCISKAKILHDSLEKCYIPNMNFDAINKACEKIFEDIKKQI